MFGQTLTIAKNTFVESVRQPIYFILILLCGILILFSTWGTGFSMGYTETSEVSSDNKLLFDIGLATVFVCGMLMAAFIATAVISREIDNKTVLTVVSKPVPRPIVVFGKYLGVVAALLVAVTTMLLFLQLAIRHGVLSTSADELDGPVITFVLLAAGIAFAVGVWCNFFYGWSFTQTTTLLLLPLFAAAFVMVLLLSKKWEWQPITKDFKAQVTLASACIILAQLVLAALATAASARLGQVMTIVVCAGVFMLGLLSNHLVGRHVFNNDWLARIELATPADQSSRLLEEPGSTYEIYLQNEPRRPINPGDSFYYAPFPSGFPMWVRPFPAFKGDVTDRMQIIDTRRPAALVVTQSDKKRLVVARAGGRGQLINREGGFTGPVHPPARNDYVFLRPTEVNAPALVLWGVIPNIQFFWLLDAVTQNQPIPASHVGLVALYGAAQVGVFLSIAVILFQRREVG